MEAMKHGPKKRTSPTVTTRWRRALARHGYRPTLDCERSTDAMSRLRFDSNGVRYSLVLQECDPHFFHIFVSYRLDGPDHSPLRILEVANETNKGLKGVKVTVMLESRAALFALEGFSSRTPMKADIQRSIAQVSRAASRFFEMLRWEAPPMARA